MDVFLWLATAIVNLVVGLLIGWSGIAGFLLPIFFVGFLKLPTTAALTLSFFDFAISGAIGSVGYHKRGHLPVKTAVILGGGSLAGALVGVWLNQLIPQSAVKLLLYLVVLLSGISILLRKEKAAGEGAVSLTMSGPLANPVLVVALGLVTGTICSLSGAGGPVLVMPLLVMLGMNIKLAIGTALMDSIFIAIPAFIGYALGSDLVALTPLLLVCGVTHAAGVLIGSKTCHHIPQKPLKKIVAVFSIAIAIYMLITLI